MIDGIRFTIPGRLEGMNNYISACRANPHVGAKMKKENQEIVEACIWRQSEGIKITEPVYIEFRWYEKNRRRDIDNVSGFGHKVILDALVQCGVIPDDSQRYVWGMSDVFLIDKRNPRIEVSLTESSQMCLKNRK